MRTTTRSTSERLHESAIGPWLRSARSLIETPRWHLRGCPPPAPPHKKRASIASVAARVRPSVFVETGTFRGDTVARMASMVPRVVSVELDDGLYEAARHRFRNTPNVELQHGDSAVLLPRIVQDLSTPALFWLDGHYSGGRTALGTATTPIFVELDSILASDVAHVILIDDARLFTGTDGYPLVDEVQGMVSRRRPNWHWSVDDDIIRIEPADKTGDSPAPSS